VCIAIVYKNNLCKAHFLTKLKNKLRNEIRLVYKDPESAYASFNFSGKNSISLNELLNHVIVKRIGYSREDIKSYLLRDKVFLSTESHIDYQQFKKNFFPQLVLIADRDEAEMVLHEYNKLTNYSSLKINTTNDSTGKKVLAGKRDDFVKGRLYDLEKYLRSRFSNTWVSVRRAFLDLDIDHDGKISAEDIMRYFGESNKEVDFYDLQKILFDLDTKKEGTLSYYDFSRWMGDAIHVREGFYFRHDSIKNPPFEEN